MSQPHDHPRPQLVRAGFQRLDGPWDFAYDDEDTGVRDRWFQPGEDAFDRTITVPFPPESPMSGIGDPTGHPYLWYRRTFSATATDDQRVVLHFGAVDYDATVWVNGQLVARHTGGHVPFHADITGALDPGGDQVVVVRAEDQPDDISQPRGKQVWGGPPRSILYQRTSGIWQSVWIETVSANHVAQVRWVADIEAGALKLRVTIAGPKRDGLRLRVALSFEGENLTDDTFSVSGGLVERSITVPTPFSAHHRNALLWSPENPNLIDAELTLLDGEMLIDAVTSYAGMRSVGFRNGKFLLNERPYYLRMALQQGYWPDSHLTAPSDDALRADVEIAKKLGFNALRLHQKVEDPRFLYWCDRLGLMTWGEMPSAYVFDETAVTRFTAEWSEAIRRDLSHPCVVAWVPTNESWGVPDLEVDLRQRAYTRMLADLARTLDGTRPVITNDGWEHTSSDILAIHDYADTAAVIRKRWGTPESTADTIAHVTAAGGRRILVENSLSPGAPVMLTEVGGIGYPLVEGERWHFWSAGSAEQLEAKYAEIIGAILESTRPSSVSATPS